MREYGQKYFGLNCEESDVLADGYKTSTFGTYHILPSLWMKFSSRLIGIDAASMIGDALASLFFNYSFLFSFTS